MRYLANNIILKMFVSVFQIFSSYSRSSNFILLASSSFALASSNSESCFVRLPAVLRLDRGRSSFRISRYVCHRCFVLWSSLSDSSAFWHRSLESFESRGIPSVEVEDCAELVSDFRFCCLSCFGLELPASFRHSDGAAPVISGACTLLLSLRISAVLKQKVSLFEIR